MHPQQPPRNLAHIARRLYLVPGAGDVVEPRERLAGLRLGQKPVVLGPRNRRRTLDVGQPGHDHLWIGAIQLPGRLSSLLERKQRDDGGRVPEFHRPSSRSARTNRLSETPRSRPGGTVRSSRPGLSVARGRSTPCRSSRASRSSSVAPVRPATGTSCATATPRSSITTVSPWRTRSIKALSRFLASVMLVRFIEP